LFFSCNKSNNTEPVANLPSEPFNPANISIDSLIRTVSELSGEKSVSILGSNYTILTRSQYFEDNNMGAEYLKSRLKSLGLSILDQKYSSSGRNILAIQQGEDKENYFILLFVLITTVARIVHFLREPTTMQADVQQFLRPHVLFPNSSRSTL
jgi:hypothetical protein